MSSPFNDLKSLLKYLIVYQSTKTKKAAHAFERFKNATVELLMLKRGKFQKRVWHISMLGLLAVGVLTSGILGNEELVASSFPGVGGSDQRVIETFDPFASGISLNTFIDVQTSISDKPRAEIIEYEVKSGETLSQIAEKFGVSQDTIKWANDMQSKESIKPGQKLKILPVSGVAHKVKSGDTLESLAKKYNTGAQGILDFPFNDVPDDQRLKIGQQIIIPDGTPPEIAPAPSKIKSPSLANGLPSSSAFSAPGGGNFMWPTAFQMITTSFAWWHPGIDMANRAAPAVLTADGGTVIVAGWPDNYGYGNRVVIDHGNGYQTLYAHLSNIYVTVGQRVSRGQTVGQMGSTGRSTGTHLHFEIRFKGIAVNPLAILR